MNNNNYSISNQNTISYDKSGSYVDQSIFHKKKSDFENFEISPDVEEIPTFTYENDRNINAYKDYINNKSQIIDKNVKNYLDFMLKNKSRKTPYTSPYNAYKEKMRNLSPIKTGEKLIMENYRVIDNKNTNQNSYNKINMLNYPYNIQRSTDENFQMPNRNLISSASAENISFKDRHEITNPGIYYAKYSKDYYNYKQEQKNYLQYNYDIMKQRQNKKDREVDINPYNPIAENYQVKSSNLKHNPIINPVNYYGYNKYLDINSRMNTNVNYNNKLQNAGNQLIINN